MSGLVKNQIAKQLARYYLVILAQYGNDFSETLSFADVTLRYTWTFLTLMCICVRSFRFTKNLSPNKISLKFLKGEGELHNLELDETTLSELLELPPWIRITKAVCNRISAKASELFSFLLCTVTNFYGSFTSRGRNHLLDKLVDVETKSFRGEIVVGELNDETPKVTWPVWDEVLIIFLSLAPAITSNYEKIFVR